MVSGRNQLTFRFTSAARPNLELKDRHFWAGEMKFRKLPTCGYKGG